MMTHSFETFWTWLQQHPNCLLRVSTPDSALYDDDAFHWFVGTDQAEHVVQQIHGKRLSGEILVDAERVTYVQELIAERQGEHAFEAIYESQSVRIPAYTFVVAHGFDDDEETDATHGGRVH